MPPYAVFLMLPSPFLYSIRFITFSLVFFPSTDVEVIQPNSSLLVVILRVSRYFKKKINLFICLFLAALGLRCCAWAFSSGGEWGLLFVAVRRLLIAVASLIEELRL